MKGTRTRAKIRFLTLPVVTLMLLCLWLPSPGLALMALPDIGIDYPTMKVIQAAKLNQMGMTDVKNGDALSMRLAPKQGQVIFKNIRTNEEVAYPPSREKAKEK